MRKLIMVLVSLAGVVALASCSKPFQLGLIIDRSAAVAASGTGSVVTLEGVSFCGPEREAPDLFGTITQGALTDSFEEHPGCDPEGKRFAVPISLTPRFTPGLAAVTITACTNPGETRLEDCITNSRSVILYAR